MRRKEMSGTCLLAPMQVTHRPHDAHHAMKKHKKKFNGPKKHESSTLILKTSALVKICAFIEAHREIWTIYRKRARSAVSHFLLSVL